MVSKSKWVGSDSPRDPVAGVARHALEMRLDLVWRYLRPAAKGPKRDIENVHQLRVATRRAMAALETFAALLPRRRRKWMHRRLKQLRKAAGDARDFDVLAARLAKQQEDQADKSLSLLLAEVKQRRKLAQSPIVAAYEQLRRKDFVRREARLLKRVRLRTENDLAEQPTFAQAAVHALRQLVEDFFAAADGNLTDPTALHAFRIQGKQLRYALEIFSGAFAASLRKKLYPQVERLQELLGEINDHASAHRHFADWIAASERPEVAEALIKMSDEETRAVEKSTAQFFAWWTTSRREKLRVGFEQLLSLNTQAEVASLSAEDASETESIAISHAPPATAASDRRA